MSPSQVNGQKQKPKRTRRELESWLAQVEDTLTRRVDQLDKTAQLLARSNQTIWTNQKELTKSEELLDEQFAVSTRMSIVAVNSILEKMGVEDRITAADVGKLFKDWSLFRSRPDYREYMMEWFLGVALDKLPPPPEPQAKKEGAGNVEDDDGNKRASEGADEDSLDGQTANVSEVQKEDGAPTQS
jgi:hypothetical protein